MPRSRLPCGRSIAALGNRRRGWAVGPLRLRGLSGSTPVIDRAAATGAVQSPFDRHRRSGGVLRARIQRWRSREWSAGSGTRRAREPKPRSSTHQPDRKRSDWSAHAPLPLRPRSERASREKASFSASNQLETSWRDVSMRLGAISKPQPTAAGQVSSSRDTRGCRQARDGGTLENRIGCSGGGGHFLRTSGLPSQRIATLRSAVDPRHSSCHRSGRRWTSNSK